MKTKRWFLPWLCLGCLLISTELKAQLTVTVTASSNVSCFGGCDGSATATAVGGIPSYTYQWNTVPVQSTATATGLCAGNYTITVFDSDSIQDTAFAAVTISEPAFLNVSLISLINISCNGGNDGEATVAVTGGTPGYFYVWNTTPVQLTPTATGLGPGTYTVTVTDSNGCTATINATIIEPSLLTAAITSLTNATCGMCDGSATVTATGGTLPYTYLWDDPLAQTTSIPTGFCAGTYNVIITDANGCVVNASVTINNIGGFTVTITTTDASCNGGWDGTATATPSGGNPPYTYLWDDGSSQTDTTATGLAAGIYTVTVTDSIGCTVTENAVINESSSITSNINTTDATCGLCDGSATANPSGGAAPYSYLWSPIGDTTQTVTGLCQGNYNLQITDSNSCTYDTAIVINNTGGFSASITSITNVSCNGGADGEATVTPVGGTPFYTYSWNTTPVQTTATATGLSAGLYDVIVTDSAGCTYSDSAIINEPAVLTISLVALNNVSCNAGSDGFATVIASGGTPAYTYLWLPGGQVTATVTGLPAGIYTVSVTDSNGCDTMANVVINEPTILIASISSKTDATCGNPNGTATVTASGGSPVYWYLWSDPDTQITQTATGLFTGTYIVLVTDVSGCTDTASVTINDISSVVFNISITDATCGNCDGSATANPASGIPPYTYFWPDSSTAQTADSLCAGTYTLQITDSTGCVSDTTISVNNTTGLTASITSVTDVICNGDSNGVAIVTPGGGTPPYTYLWNDPLAQTDSVANNLAPGNYNATVTDNAGCTFTANTVISAPVAIVVALIPANISCGGNNDGSITVNATGGAGSYLFSIDSGATWTTDSFFFNLFPGTYYVLVQDGNSCQANDSAIITTSTGLVIIPIVTNASCGWYDGSIILNVSGGLPPYTYQWDPGYWWWGSVKYYLPVGFYNITVTDAGTCTADTTIFVGDGCAPNLIQGKVFDDMNTNCLMDSADFGLFGWMVRADPGGIVATVDNSGNYYMYLDSGNFTISLIDNDVLRTQVCPSSPSTYSISLGSSPDTVNNIDFSVQSASYCPAMEVSLIHIGFRPCFCSWYRVHYNNNGTGTANNAYIELELPSEVTATTLCSSGSWNSPPYNSTPWDSQSGNTYTYNLGNVPPQGSGLFYVLIEISCNAVINSTLCVTAHIYPDSSCFPPDSVWDKSSVEVVGSCTGDSLACFTITNTGDPGEGDMQGTSEYRIYENNILVHTGTFQIDGGNGLIICWPANGNTIRLEADQRPGHPGNSHPQDNVELCGAPPFITGQITQVPEDDADDFVEIVCAPVTSSWDPNDKGVLPEGLTTTYHYIDSTDVLEYLIRFQNTGNDTAFKVVIRDTLSPYLDITTIRPGASSHSYTLDIFGSDVLQWTFENILLPDSIIDEPASHGFVKFKIHQQPGNTKGTVIENNAGIIFDFNEPVITNTVFNTIGNIDSVTTTGLPKIYDDEISVKVYPNPFNSTTTFEIRGIAEDKPLTFSLYNIIGERVKEVFDITGNKFIISRENLPGGIYIYKINSDTGLIGAGKLVVN